MPRKHFPGRQPGLAAAAAAPCSGLPPFQAAYLLLLIAQLAVREQGLLKRGAVNQSRCAPPSAPLLPPSLLLWSRQPG